MRVDLDEVAAEQSVSRDELKSIIAELRLLRILQDNNEICMSHNTPCIGCFEKNKHADNCPVKALEAME